MLILNIIIIMPNYTEIITDPVSCCSGGSVIETIDVIIIGGVDGAVFLESVKRLLEGGVVH